MPIEFHAMNQFDKTTRFLAKLKSMDNRHILEKYAQMGLQALSDATPVDTGKTAASWYYEITGDNKRGYKIEWKNSNLAEGWAPVALLIQFGHGTRNGGYVEGIDYINPALRPVFEQFALEIRQEVQA